ncbi:MAG: nitrogen regulation protein NR(II) [Candidatus Ornithospirochaeta sp.]
MKKFAGDLSSCPEGELKNLITQSLEESDLYASLFNNLQDGHVIIDEKGTVVLANRRLFTLVPYQRKYRNRPLEGMSIKECISDKDLSSYIENVLNGKEKGEDRDFTLQVGSELRTLRISFLRLCTDKNQYMDITISDISEDIRKETRLRRSESLASMTTMAAGVAHEIKNPLAAMQIHTQLMRKAFQKYGSLDEEKAEKYLNVIEEETAHLNKIAVDFLFAVKPMEVELRLGSLNENVEEVVSFLLPEAEERGIKVETKLDSFLPRIQFDARLVKQALLNLVQNAFAAMAENGKLTIISKSDGDYQALIIRDNGSGIPEEKLSKIFEPYYTTKASGTGLGLTLVYKIMKEHNGDIHVKSEVGKGTEFILLFPVPVSERKALEAKS